MDFLDFCLWDRRNGGNPRKAQNLSILYSPLLFRKPFPRPLWISWISGSRTAEMEGTPQKPKSCRFCRVRSFSGSHFHGTCGFLDFRLLGPPKWRRTPQKRKSCRFCRVRSFSGSHFRPWWISWISGSRTAEMEGTPQKPKSCRFCRVRSFSGSHFQGPCGFPDFRL